MSHSSPGVEVNHLKLFIFGFLFYWIVPAVVVPSGEFYAAVDSVRIAQYLWIVGGICLCFLIGDSFGRMLHYHPQSHEALRGFALLYWPTFFTTAFLICVHRGELFAPYSDNPLRGTLTAMTMLLFAIALVRISLSESPSFQDRYLIGYFLLASVLMLTGERLYFVSSVLALLIYRSCYLSKIRVRTLAFGGLAGMALVGFIGVFRLSFGAELHNFLWNFVTESFYTSISLFDYLKYQREPIYAFPLPLLTQLQNLVPTAIAGDKSGLLNVGIYSPLGAMNSYISWMRNFGIVGSFVAALILGFFLRWLRVKQGALSKVIYSVMASWVAFSFFRDDFGVSVVRNMLENSIIFPVAIYCFTWTATAVTAGICRTKQSRTPYRNCPALPSPNRQSSRSAP